MSGQRGGSAEFHRVMESLAADPDGWNGPAGEAFVALVHRVLAPMISSRNRASSDSKLLVDPSDAVTEAVLVVEGPERLTLSQNVHRILEMERPLGYVVGSVAKNLSRTELAGQMGAGSRQVARGTSRILHFDELTPALDADPLDRLSAEAAWPGGQGEASDEARMVANTFIGVLAQRFQVRRAAARRGLEIAGTAALEGDTGAGMTPATTRRRIGLFMKELPALRGTFNRAQAQAFAWLLFGTERHPEWSLLAECARATRERDAVQVSVWHARHARTVAARGGQFRREPGRQPALFPLHAKTARTRRMSA